MEKLNEVFVSGVGICEIVQVLDDERIVEDESGTRVRVHVSRCLNANGPEAQAVQNLIGNTATLEDQFTGADLGAEMAAAEGDDPATVDGVVWFDEDGKCHVRFPLEAESGVVVSPYADDVFCSDCIHAQPVRNDDGSDSYEVLWCLSFAQFRAINSPRGCSLYSRKAS